MGRKLSAMGFSVVTSAASHHRIALARDWLGVRAPAEEILIIGATLGAANEIARIILKRLMWERR